MNKNKYYIIILIMVIALVVVYNNNKEMEGDTGTSVVDDRRTYSGTWRTPANEELREITKLMVKNNISGCGEYHVKELEPKEFLIACSADGSRWTYYVAWPNLDKIQMASVEMEEKLAPPY